MLVVVRRWLCCVLFLDHCPLFGVWLLLSHCVSFVGCRSLRVVCCLSRNSLCVVSCV